MLALLRSHVESLALKRNGLAHCGYRCSLFKTQPHKNLKYFAEQLLIGLITRCARSSLELGPQARCGFKRLLRARSDFQMNCLSSPTAKAIAVRERLADSFALQLRVELLVLVVVIGSIITVQPKASG